jgi:hypothetical protein
MEKEPYRFPISQASRKYFSRMGVDIEKTDFDYK